MDHVQSAPARTPRTRRLTTRLAGVTTIAVVAAGFSASAAQASYTPEVWDRVAQCESGGNWSINTGNGYYGGLQFHPQTWKGFGGGTYAGYAHQASKAEQIAIARRVLHAQGPGAWPVCSVKAGLTRSNGGADPNAKPGDGKEEPAPGQPVTRYVSASNAANVRSGPGLGYDVVGAKARGTEVNGTIEQGWLKIGDGQFISGSVLSDSPVKGNDPAPDPGPVTRYVSASNAANVRSGAGLDYRVVGAKTRGAQVSGTMTSNGWLEIGANQFISSSVLSSSPVDGTVTRYVSASNAANVRSGPGLGYRVVDGKARGVKVVGTLDNGWLKIGDGQYISSTVLSKWAV
ncbi:transglycosylase family protein [Ornithinimicrobium faecis]|uniref:transglycosylase family protein n=1 Tax=Ornithinimicrobium faecis TaxID=2934158 RepID=UPI0025AD15B0|nr:MULTISPECIES: transglycosylase family protein [unclassified Ornithinimicrobium]